LESINNLQVPLPHMGRVPRPKPNVQDNGRPGSGLAKQTTKKQSSLSRSRQQSEGGGGTTYVLPSDTDDATAAADQSDNIQFKKSRSLKGLSKKIDPKKVSNL
jgi:hypothetical protein